jgi:hypothetical protein
MTLEKIIANLNDIELKICFEEIVQWRKEGVLNTEAFLRKVWEEFKVISPTFPIHAMTEPVLFEIAKRHYGGESV